MPRDGTATRSKIMDAAQQLILQVGLIGTSVEKVIEDAGVTKSTFFYHFKTKHELAAALIERFADEDLHHLSDALSRAEQLSRDPLQQLLLFVGLFIEFAEQLEEPFPGCLYASYCYQSGAVSKAMMAEVEKMMRLWRAEVSRKIAEVQSLSPSRIPVDREEVADHVLTTFEGAFILSKVMNEPKLAAQQLVQCRNYLELLFQAD